MLLLLRSVQAATSPLIFLKPVHADFHLLHGLPSALGATSTWTVRLLTTPKTISHSVVRAGAGVLVLLRIEGSRTC